MLLFKLAFFPCDSTLLKRSYNMINQKKYVQFVMMYIIIFSLWIFLIPKDLNIKEIEFSSYFVLLQSFLAIAYINQLRR